MDGSQNISHQKRIEILLSGKSGDRTPVALWRHFPVADQDPHDLARQTIDFQERYDFDLVKLSPSSSFQVADWGVTDEWTGNPEGSREYTIRAIHRPDDWLKIQPHSAKRGHLAQQLACLKLVTSHFKADTPVLQTIFSPLSQAKNLAGNDLLIQHIRQYPDLVSKALQSISETTIEFIKACGKLDLAGVFYAVQHAQFGLLSGIEFDTFGRKFDLEVLAACKPFWCNMVHIHGEAVQFDAILDYPVQIFNWHDQSTPPSLKEALTKIDGVVCGGLRQWQTMVLGTPDRVTIEARAAIRQCNRRRLLLGTGCVTPITAPDGNIMSARKSVER